MTDDEIRAAAGIDAETDIAEALGELKGRTHTQAGVDKLVTTRLDRQKAQNTKALRDALGIGEDIDPTDAIAELREKADAAPTDADVTDATKAVEKRWQDKLDALTAATDAKVTTLTSGFKARLIDQEVRAVIAGKADTLTADGALLLAPQLAKMLGVNDETMVVQPIDAEGNPLLTTDGKEQSPGDVFAGLLELYPSTVRATGGGGSASPNVGKQSTRIAEAQAAYQKDPSQANYAAAIAATMNPDG